MKEEWRPINGFEGYYEVSNLGRIRSLDRWMKIGAVWQLKKGIIRKPKLNASGYYTVDLSVNKNRKHLLVHRAVASAFIPNPHNYAEVNHKDECKTNNVYTNLEWCTHAYNNNYGTHNEKISMTMKRIKAA